MTQNFDVFAKRKGQSAIEYLMTYGWMLLVVAIVSGAIFATVQGQCTSSTSGFAGGDVAITDFGPTAGDDMAFSLENTHSEPVEVNNISIDGEGFLDDSVSISTGESSTASVQGLDITSVDGCNDYDLTIEYDVDGGIQDQTSTGTLTDSLSITAN